VELGLGRNEGGVALRRVDEELDIRPHRAERPADHDDLVAVTGGSWVSRTTGGLAAWSRRSARRAR
jgi:hypothetical protein